MTIERAPLHSPQGTLDRQTLNKLVMKLLCRLYNIIRRELWGTPGALLYVPVLLLYTTPRAGKKTESDLFPSNVDCRALAGVSYPELLLARTSRPRLPPPQAALLSVPCSYLVREALVESELPSQRI